MNIIQQRMIQRMMRIADEGAGASGGASGDTGGGIGDTNNINSGDTSIGEVSDINDASADENNTNEDDTNNSDGTYSDLQQSFMNPSHPTPQQKENVKSQNIMLKGVSDNGRTLLQAMAKWKYQISQCIRIAGNDDRIAKKIEQNLTIVDSAMAEIYSVCFAIENLELTPIYTKDQLLTGDGNDELYNLDEVIPAEEDIENENTKEDTSEGETTEEMDEIDNEMIDNNEISDIPDDYEEDIE